MPALDHAVHFGARRVVMWALFFGAVMALLYTQVGFWTLLLLPWAIGAIVLLYRGRCVHIYANDGAWQVHFLRHGREALYQGELVSARRIGDMVWLDLLWHTPVHTQEQIIIFKDEIGFDGFCALGAQVRWG